MVNYKDLATVKQVDETAEAEMGKLTGGLNIPGL